MAKRPLAVLISTVLTLVSCATTTSKLATVESDGSGVTYKHKSVAAPFGRNDDMGDFSSGVTPDGAWHLDAGSATAMDNTAQVEALQAAGAMAAAIASGVLEALIPILPDLISKINTRPQGETNWVTE